MRIFRPWFWKVCALVLLFGEAGSRRLAAQQNATPVEALELFSKLGLPNAQGATWVTANGSAMSYTGNLQLSGNAWLVKQDKDGTVDLIINQAELIRARSQTGQGPDAGDSVLPGMFIQPADLGEDIKKLEALLPRDDDSPDVGDDEETASFNPRQPSGSMLLFLAHLSRVGKLEDATRLLPRVLRSGRTPQAVLDQAVSLLADARLTAAGRHWERGGDALAYGKAIDALCQEYSRGWDNREAALLLGERLKDQKPSAGGLTTEGRKAADLLLGMSADQMAALQTNWLLPPVPGAVADTIEGGSRALFRGKASRRFRGRNPGRPDALPASSAIGALLADRRNAVRVLVTLLSDRRLGRALRTGNNRSYRSDNDIPTQEERYEALARPYELREICNHLLSPVLPDRLRHRPQDTNEVPAEILAWAGEISAMGDLQLAWYYLEESNGAQDWDFQAPLAYLVRREDEGTRAKLKQVFLDGAVWEDGFSESLVPELAHFASQLGEARADFGRQMATVVRTALETKATAAAEARKKGDGEVMPEEEIKRYAAQREGQIKMLEQVFNPRGIGDLLAEIGKAGADEVMTLVGSVGPAFEAAAWEETEAATYQAAAALGHAHAKGTLLAMLASKAAGVRSGDAKRQDPIPADAGTRAALEALLRDESAASAGMEHARSAATSSVADFALDAFIWTRLPTAEAEAWQALIRDVPHVATPLLKTHAVAVVSGTEPAPRPDPAQVSRGRIDEHLAKLAAMKPVGVLSTIQAMMPAEQIAVIKHVQTLDEIPRALADANMTVVAVKHDPPDQPKLQSAQSYIGRQFDEALRKEVETALIRAAREGSGLIATVRPVGILAGLVLETRSNLQMMPPEAALRSGVPGIEGGDAPVALVAAVVQGGGIKRGSGSNYFYSFPIWNDEARSAEWLSTHLKRGAAGAATSAPAKPRRDPTDARPYDTAFATLLQEGRGFTLHWYTNLVRKPDSDP